MQLVISSYRGYSGGGPTQGTIGFMDGYTDGGHVSSGHPPSGPPWPNKPLPVGKGQVSYVAKLHVHV